MAEEAVSGAPFLDNYRARFERSWKDETPIGQVRFVVLDCETTGLNPRTDRIITIGAVAVRDGEIVLGDSFESLLKVTENTSAVTVHGITRDESLKGIEESEALEGFLDYLQDGVIVGHHIGHDIASLDAACARHWDVTLLNRSLDTMDLTLHLERDGAFAGRPANPQVHPRCALRDVWSHPSRSPHRERRRLHHRAGVLEARASGHANGPRHPGRRLRAI